MNYSAGGHMRTHFVLAALCLAMTASAQPTEAEFMAEVTDNAAAEYVECAAYFLIVSQGLLKAGDTKTAKAYEDAYSKAMERSVMLASQSRTEAMALDVTRARFRNNTADMWKTIDNNFSNLSLLSSKHGTSCLEAMTDASAVFDRWAQKIASRYQKPPKK